MNKVVLMGRLTKDPEIRYTSNNNTAVASFTLAVERDFVKQGEERQADFIPIVAWSKHAELCSKWYKKGQLVAIVGHIQNRSWEDNEGKKRYTTEVVVEECHFAESKRNEESGNNAQISAQSGTKQEEIPPLDDDELPF
jgi:single-strand DNA-binding protein